MSTVKEVTPAVRKGQLLIDGEWRDSVTGKTFESVDPATGEVIGVVAEGSREDVDLAVKAARRAFDDRHSSWRAMSATDRGRLLNRIAAGIAARKDELALLETSDNGKAISESSNLDVPFAVDCFEYYAGLANKVFGETIPVPKPFFTYTLREPVGVCAQIVPWNFPLVMSAWKIAPALACGNTVVLKPAEWTPLTALVLGEILQEAGVPPGVVNIVTGFGDASTGEFLASHPEIDKIAFTGETVTGKKIMKMAADGLKRVSLELGGKSPCIVLDDADVERAVETSLPGLMICQGQQCAGASRLLVQKSIHKPFMESYVERARQLRVGDPKDPQTQIGAIANAEQMKKVKGYIDLGKQEGARLACGGGTPEGAPDKGLFLEPTVFDEVENRMRIAQEEIFGPVVSIIEFDGIDEGIALANNVSYGLASAIYTSDIRKAHYFVENLRAGTIWVNTYGRLFNEAPFGGYKASGLGRELGTHAIDLYTEVKTVHMDTSSEPPLRWFG